VQAQKRLEQQDAALASLEKERAHAAHLKGRLGAAEKRLKAIEWEHEVCIDCWSDPNACGPDSLSLSAL
jgi:hypothetical protein